MRAKAAGHEAQNDSLAGGADEAQRDDLDAFILRNRDALDRSIRRSREAYARGEFFEGPFDEIVAEGGKRLARRAGSTPE